MVVGRGVVKKRGKYERWSIRSKAQFIASSLRTHDIGRPGRSKRLAGRLKKTGKWATKTMLIGVKEPPGMKAKLRKQAKAMIRRSRK